MTEPNPAYILENISASPTFAIDQELAALRDRLVNLQARYDEVCMLRQEIVKAQSEVNNDQET